MIGVASLSLAACGGGDSTVQTAPAQIQTPPDNQDPDLDCTAVPQPAGCESREPVVLMPFAGLSSSAKALAYSAIQKAYFGIDSTPIDLQGNDNNEYLDNMALQITAWKDIAATDEGTFGRGMLTKVVKVTPSGSVGDIDYVFNLWTTGVLVGNSIYRVDYPDDQQIDTSLTELLVDDSSFGAAEVFSIEEDDYTAKNINLRFDESYQYNVMKDYQVLSAEVDTDKDNTKDSTLHAELWTDYSGDTTSDYLVGGFWLLVPKDMTKDYSFGGFVRGEADPVFPSSKIKPSIGGATYKGSLAGIHTSSEDGMSKISRLLGKVTIDADFGTTSTYGRIEGSAYDLKLDGTPVGGEILINIDMDSGDRGPVANEVNLRWAISMASTTKAQCRQCSIS